MIGVDPNMPFYDPSSMMMQPDFNFGNPMFMNQPLQMQPMKPKKQNSTSSGISRIPSLYFPAILLFWFSWLLHTIATFIPYWSVYPLISGSRAGF